MKARFRKVTYGAAIAMGLGLSIPAGLIAQDDPNAEAIEEARVAAEAWLAIVDAREFGESWDESAAAFQEAVGRDGWIRQLSAVRAPHEPFGTREVKATQYVESIPGAPPGPYVVLDFTTSVVGGRTVTERVVPMREQDGVWRVSGYYVLP